MNYDLNLTLKDFLIRKIFIIFTRPLRSGKIWHKVNFLSGV